MSECHEPVAIGTGARNAFGVPLYEIKDVLQDSAIEAVVQALRRGVFKYLGIPDERADIALKECLDCARGYTDVAEYERSAHAVLEREGIVQAIPGKLAERARIMYEQIRPHLVPGSVLDLGCGDANVARLLARDGFVPYLADIYENPGVAGSGLPFTLLRKGEAVPFRDDEFDNTLLLTVLHHTDDPVQVMREAQRITRSGGRVIVIESVYGVNGQEISPAQRARAHHYLALTQEQQRKVNIFFDHFYIRVIQYAEDPSRKENVPFNFNTPLGWRELFEAHGLKEERLVHLGTDQPTVPEYHTLHVLSPAK